MAAITQLNYRFVLSETFPDELIRDILLRLSVQHLLPLKRVSKSWRSFLSDPEFAKSHFDVATAPSHHLIIKFRDNPEAKCIDIDKSLEDNSENVVINVPNPSPSPFRKIGETIVIVGSCRGLVLIQSKASRSFLFEFIIWNPSTGFYKRFSKVSFWRSWLGGIGYDSSTDDYVAVVTIFPILPRLTRFHCFSLRNNSWSCTLSSVPYQVNLWPEHGSFLNGAIHWVVQVIDDRDRPNIILAFDVRERSLSEILLPPITLNGLSTHHMRVMGGCLGLCILGTDVLAEMWIMKEYKVHSSWSKLFVLGASVYLNSHMFFPICFTGNDEILGHDGLTTLMKLDDNGELIEQRRFPLRSNRYGNRIQYCGMLAENLLTLPNNI